MEVIDRKYFHHGSLCFIRLTPSVLNKVFFKIYSNIKKHDKMKTGGSMDKKELERLFVQVQANVEKKYEEECAMAMDCFIEEDFDFGECTRFLEYLLTLVKEEKADDIQMKMEHFLDSFH